MRAAGPSFIGAGCIGVGCNVPSLATRFCCRLAGRQWAALPGGAVGEGGLFFETYGCYASLGCHLLQTRSFPHFQAPSWTTAAAAPPQTRSFPHFFGATLRKPAAFRTFRPVFGLKTVATRGFVGNGGRKLLQPAGLSKRAAKNCCKRRICCRKTPARRAQRKGDETASAVAACPDGTSIFEIAGSNASSNGAIAYRTARPPSAGRRSNAGSNGAIAYPAAAVPAPPAAPPSPSRYWSSQR